MVSPESIAVVLFDGHLLFLSAPINPHTTCFGPKFEYFVRLATYYAGRINRHRLPFLM